MYLLFAAVTCITAKYGRARRPLLLGGAASYVVASVIAALHYNEVSGMLNAWPPAFEPLNASETGRWFFYLSPYFRFSQFIMGACAALAVMRAADDRFRSAIMIAAAAALVGLAWLHLKTVFAEPVGPAIGELLDAAFFAVLMANSRADTWLNRALAKRSAEFLGVISYSLFHGFPIPWTGASNVGDFTWPLFAAFCFNFFLSISFAIMFAWGIYNMLEVPEQRWLRDLRKRGEVARALAVPRSRSATIPPVKRISHDNASGSSLQASKLNESRLLSEVA